MTKNKNFLKTCSILIPFGVMFSSPVRAEIIPPSNKFVQFGIIDPKCGTTTQNGIIIKCESLPIYKQYYSVGFVDYCKTEATNGTCAETRSIQILTNDDNYISTVAKYTQIQSAYDKKYKIRSTSMPAIRLIGYTNCGWRSSGSSLPAFQKCNLIYYS